MLLFLRRGHDAKAVISRPVPATGDPDSRHFAETTASLEMLRQAEIGANDPKLKCAWPTTPSTRRTLWLFQIARWWISLVPTAGRER
jgi:hypothetical protein